MMPVSVIGFSKQKLKRHLEGVLAAEALILLDFLSFFRKQKTSVHNGYEKSKRKRKDEFDTRFLRELEVTL